MKAAQQATESAEGSGELREAIALQEAAHNAVKEAAEAAQSAHDNMLQWNAEVDRQREKAEAAHRKLRTSKKEADKEHSLYIVSSDACIPFRTSCAPCAAPVPAKASALQPAIRRRI